MSSVKLTIAWTFSRDALASEMVLFHVSKTFPRFVYLLLCLLRKLFSSGRFFSHLINGRSLIGDLFIEKLYSVVYGALLAFNFASDRFDLVKNTCWPAQHWS